MDHRKPSLVPPNGSSIFNQLEQSGLIWTVALHEVLMHAVSAECMRRKTLFMHPHVLSTRIRSVFGSCPAGPLSRHRVCRSLLFFCTFLASLSLPIRCLIPALSARPRPSLWISRLRPFICPAWPSASALEFFCFRSWSWWCASGVTFGFGLIGSLGPPLGTGCFSFRV